MAKMILEKDGRLIATARNVKKIKQSETDYPHRALVIEMDATKENEVENAVAAALKEYDTIDVLINNAGYGISGAVEEISDGEYRKILDTHVFGLMNVTRAVRKNGRYGNA